MGRPVARPASVVLTWRPLSDGGRAIRSYRIQVKAPGSTTWKTLATQSASKKRQFTAKKLRNGRSYSFRVAAINGDGIGPYSKAVKATPRPAPAAPRSFSVTAGDRSALLEWATPAKNGTTTITGYRIQRRTAGGRFDTVTTVGAAARSHRVTGLTNGTTQTFRINARSSMGQGAFSPTRSATLTVTLGMTAGSHHTCAILPDTTVNCWGADDSGQLGDGTVGGDDRLDAVTVIGPDGVTALRGVTQIDAAPAEPSGSNGATCARTDAGRALCWGSNLDDRLGSDHDGSASAVARTVLENRGTDEDPDLQPLGNVASVSMGAAHGCALLTDTTVRCWGKRTDGQLGDGPPPMDAPPSATAVTVLAGPGLPLSGVTQLVTGGYFTCALVTNGTVSCWGNGGDGEIGDGFDANRANPTQVASLTNVTSIGAGTSHACAVLADTSVRCWGRNSSGQIGDGASGDARLLPVAVGDPDTPLTGVAAVGLGKESTCARMTDGTVRCWGDNFSGQLGDGTTDAQLTPVTVLQGGAPLTGARRLSTGGDHSCVRDDLGFLRCWGYNANGQVGDGSTDNRLSAVPVTAL
jgi:alpha-tubulin suppressor-like RCC1 family protein